jgi:hypothetical protein
MLKTVLATALLAVTTSLYAQPTPPKDADKSARRQELREKAKSARDEARKACEGKQGAEHRDCMTKSTCAKAPDPAKCEARAKAREERVKKRREEKSK